MEFISYAFDVFMHLDKHLGEIIQQYGFWTHALLFLIIFCETGLVVTPFLPGDSLLFAAGAFAALGSLDIAWLAITLPLASIAGDSSNYWIGRIAGPRIFSSGRSRLLNRNHLDQTHRFYEKYGRKTVIVARFVPIVRTFAPFVAGIGRMSYAQFVTFSIVGSILWILTFTLGGYFFGNIPVVKHNFTLVIMAIIVISILPGIIGYIRARREKTDRSVKPTE